MAEPVRVRTRSLVSQRGNAGVSRRDLPGSGSSAFTPLPPAVAAREGGVFRDVGWVIERDCVIAGGGPAGMFLGYALARAGVRVTVLEKHEDFLRDFRGDTIHPSTITTLGELGLREAFLQLPLNRITTVDVVMDGQRLTMVDFRRLPSPDNFLVMAPQWDLLNFLAAESQKLPNHELRMVTEATDLVVEDGQVRGLRAHGPDGALTIRALHGCRQWSKVRVARRCGSRPHRVRCADRCAVVQHPQAVRLDPRHARIHVGQGRSHHHPAW
jgi:2-polyprenyl-6-methoxyphenol hydroxylase-like FAD-dependent oxidoreductase